MKSFVLYGAGGHAKVIVDLIQELGEKIECVFDDNVNQSDASFMGIPIKKYDSQLYKESKIIIAIGNNNSRRALTSILTHDYATLIHPKAVVSKLAKIGKGTVVLANAVIQAEAIIGDHVIVNVAACIEHEVLVEDFVHISPLAYIGGAAIIDSGVNILPHVHVLRNSRVQNSNNVILVI